MVPDSRGTIAAHPNPAPRAAIVVDGAAASPTPSPATPSPGLVAINQSSDPNPDPKRDQRRSWIGLRNVHHRRVVDRYIHHLRIRRLNHIDGLIGDLLHLNLLLFIAFQRSRRISLSPQTLDRIRHLLLVSRHRLPDRSIVVDVIRHHLQHIREGHQRNERRIVSLLLRGIGQRRAG
jgi:hypothetical protein